MNRLPYQRQITAIASLCEGVAVRAVARIVHAHHDTIGRLALHVGEGCYHIHDELFRKVSSKYIELDEAWSFLFKKQGHRETGDRPEYGDQYFYTAVDADNKAIISYLSGKRNAKTTAAFALDLKSRLATTPQISSDGFHPYVKAVAGAFGDANVDYAMIIKMYAAECAIEAKRRYSPADVMGHEKIIVFGDPSLSHISTSYVERQNLTLRMHTRRFTRLTNAFSKKLRNHCAALDLYVANYNFVRVHETLKTTPAVAIGVTGHVWTIEELAETALKLGATKPPPVRKGSQQQAAS
jgi:IS1 family transposase